MAILRQAAGLNARGLNARGLNAAGLQGARFNEAFLNGAVLRHLRIDMKLHGLAGDMKSLKNEVTIFNIN